MPHQYRHRDRHPEQVRQREQEDFEHVGERAAVAHDRLKDLRQVWHEQHKRKQGAPDERHETKSRRGCTGSGCARVMPACILACYPRLADRNKSGTPCDHGLATQSYAEFFEHSSRWRANTCLPLPGLRGNHRSWLRALPILFDRHRSPGSSGGSRPDGPCQPRLQRGGGHTGVASRESGQLRNSRSFEEQGRSLFLAHSHCALVDSFWIRTDGR